MLSIVPGQDSPHRHAFRHDADTVVLIVVPHRRAVNETAARIKSVTPRSKGISVQSMSAPSDFDNLVIAKRLIAITTPSNLLRIDDPAISQLIRKLDLVVLEDLHLLDDQYELATARILSIARPAKTRIIGITSSLNDPTDLAEWLGVDPACRYSFLPQDRGNTIVVSTKTFTLAHSATLLKTMVKPAYDVVKAAPSGTIIFVPSRAACRAVANDMVTQSGNEMDLNGFLRASREDVEPLLGRLKDTTLFEPILHGIGYIIPGSPPSDLALVLELFASGILRALIVPRESCWTLPVRASTVVLMGAQYIQVTGGDREDRRVVNYSRTELVKMQGFAVPSASHLVEGGRMFVMCQPEQSLTISRVLADGLPLESTIPTLLRRQSFTESITALGRMLKYRQPPPPPQINRRRIPDLRKRDMMDLLGWTYFSKRIKSNPTFYDVQRSQEGEDVSRLVDEWFKGLADEFGPVPSSLASGLNSAEGSSRERSRSGSVSASVLTSTFTAETGDSEVVQETNGSEEVAESWAGHANGTAA